MEPRFICKYQMSEKIMNDLSKWAIYRSPKAIAFYILFGISTLTCFSSIALHAVEWLVYGEWPRLDLELVLLSGLLVVLMLYFYLFQYLICKRRNRQRIREMYHGTPPVFTLSFFEDCYVFQNSASGSENALYYADFRRIYRTNQYVYIQTKSKMLDIVPVCGIQNGNQNDFIDFLHNKGIKG